MLVNEIIAYHGSEPRDTVGFALSHKGQGSHTFGDYSSERWGVFFSNNPEFAELYGEVEPYDLLVTKTADLDNKAQLSMIVGNFIDAVHHKDLSLARNAQLVLQGSWSLWQLFEEDLGKAFVKYLLSLGYDSASFTEYNENDSGQEIESLTTVVLKPNKIVKNNQLQLDLE